MTVELAHPSIEPQAAGSPTESAHPRWWFFSTTPGRILTMGIILAIPRRAHRVRHLDDDQQSPNPADERPQPH